MAIRLQGVACLVAALTVWAAPASAAAMSVSINEGPGVQPTINPCALRPPPAPYGQKYNHVNYSGSLDAALLHDSEVTSIQDVQRVSDGLQAHIEQLRCEQANTKLLLRQDGGEGECPLGPPTPYDTN